MGAVKRMSNGEEKPVGPHPSTIRVSPQYLSQGLLDKKLCPSGTLDIQERSSTEAREDSVRLQGVTWIDTVRRALQLPVKTYTTACVYYHRFRLAHPGSLAGVEYGNAWADACAASLLTACKVEDTLKKSRDILAAAHNLKASPHDHLGADDGVFEAPSRAVIGLERMVLEASGFDFRSRQPHPILVKLSKMMPEGVDGERTRVTEVAWTILTDLYRTFAPLKQTCITMALASLELAAHLVVAATPNNTSAIRDALLQFDYHQYTTSRDEIMETLLDLLDLYTHHSSTTILGPKYSLDDFLRIRLAFNKECSENQLPRNAPAAWQDRQPPAGSTLQVANGHPTPVSPPQQQDAQQQNTGAVQHNTPEGGGTLRFMLNPQLAADEKATVQRYFVEEWEEYEEEVEVPLPRRGASRDRERERGAGRDGPPDERDAPPRGRNERDRRDHRERERGFRDHEREREGRRFEDRRFDERERERDRRFEDRRDRRFEGGRYEDERRRREERR